MLHTKLIRENVSIVASDAKVRNFITEELKVIAKQKGILLEGRDIATIVMPDADVKFYIEVEPEIKAFRRSSQLQKSNIIANYDEILENILKRDYLDSTRSIAPLKKTESSIVIYNNYLPINQTIKSMFKSVKKLANQDFTYDLEIINEINRYNELFNLNLARKKVTFSYRNYQKNILKIQKTNLKIQNLNNE